MASTTLSQKQLNFARFAIVCVDILKRPLKDILNIFIQPAELGKKIKECQSLLAGKHKLNQDQKKNCCFNSSNIPDYSKFDVSLLYKLIRNLCPTLEPTNKWSNTPTVNDVCVGDDIERIRTLRNECFAHIESAEISDGEFQRLWNDAKCMIQRCQQFTTSKGCKTDYNQMIVDLERKTLTFDEYIYSKERSGAIYILEDTEVLCGETACFEAEITSEEDVDLPVSWNKVHRSVWKEIDIEDDKYKGSDSRRLFIHNVRKEDEAGYQAVLSRKKDVKIFSNTGFLRAMGEPPCLEELNVTADEEGIYIHYVFKVSENSPIVKGVKWAKNALMIDLPNDKYSGGKPEHKFIRILRPDEDDKGEYTCTVSNAVGSVSKSVKLDKPKAILPATTKVIIGSETRIDCLVSGCPPPYNIEWQKSIDGTSFIPIDIYMENYFGSIVDQCPPFLLVHNATLNDQQYYRVVVSNRIGKYTSDEVFLQVTGDRPNMSKGTCTVQGCSVKLKCDVFLYEDSPAINNVDWTKNGIKLDIAKSAGKYLGADINDPSLTINNVNFNDAGDYQLIAANDVGKTESEVIVLGDPEVQLEKIDQKADGSMCFTMTIKSVPVPHFVQWSMKENNSESFQPINVNAAEYNGTSNSFPNPVLVLKHREKLENYIFVIEVHNRVGEGKTSVPGKCNLDNFKRDQQTIGKFYTDSGSRLPFAKLFDQLSEEFPIEKINRLKYLIQLSCNIEDVTGLEKAESAADCFLILQKEHLFTPSDVIVMQFLLRQTNCEKLEKECVEYAKNRKTWYYYETPPENGFRNVHFHVVANLHNFNEEDENKIRETVAYIAGCSIEDIKVHGYLPSASFFIILSIKDNYIERLLAVKQKDKDILSELNIDYFKEGINKISIERTSEYKEEQKGFHHSKGTDEPSNEFFLAAEKAKKKSEPSKMETENREWILPVTSPDFQRFLQSFQINIPEDLRQSSFAQSILSAMQCKKIVDTIKLLSKRVILQREIHSSRLGSVQIFEVEVICTKGKFVVIEKDASQRFAFFHAASKNMLRIIWIYSKSLSVIDAKLAVFMNYELCLERETIFLQHAFDNTDNVIRFSAYQQVESLENNIDAIAQHVQRHDIGIILQAATNKVLSKESITQLCYNIYLRDNDIEVGTVASRSYSCRSIFTVLRLKEQLVDITLKETAKKLGSEICRGLLKYIGFKIEEKLEQICLLYKSEIVGKKVATFIDAAVAIVVAMVFPFHGIINEVGALIGTSVWSVDVNSMDWRRNVADEILDTLNKHKTEMLEEIESEVEFLCWQASQELKAVLNDIADFKRKIGYIKQKSLIYEWKRRKVFKNDFLKKIPSVLTYLAGTRDGAPVVKVFLTGDDKKDVKFYIREHYPTYHFEFVDVDTESKKISEDMEKIEQFEQFAPEIGKETRTQMNALVKRHAQNIFANHSSIIGIEISSVRSITLQNELCIVLLCLDECILPYGESPIPKTLEGYPCDVRKEFLMLGHRGGCKTVNIGCGIGIPSVKLTGSVGFFVRSADSTGISRSGFLTAAHVAIENYDELYEHSSLLSKHSLARECHKIIHLSYADSSVNNIIGEVIESFFGNYGPNGTGIDAAFVQTDQQILGEKMYLVDDKSLVFNGRLLVKKKGSATGDTFGKLVGDCVCVRVYSTNGHGRYYEFENCFAVKGMDRSRSFFDHGDSGSGVYLIDEKDNSLKPLGIAFAFFRSKTVVCKIGPITNAFNVSVHGDNDLMDTL